ncbi:hypothetical protein CR513_06259, partial [Mucuna pruriens]
MVRRIVSTFIEDDQSQRKSIFHSRCMIQGEICYLIMDGSSSVNVANQILEELIMDKKVFVIVTLGKYKDKILCDVVLMEATHVTHGGVINKFSFVHKGKRGSYRRSNQNETKIDEEKKNKQKERKSRERKNFFKEVVRPYKTIVSDRGSNKFDTKLLFSTTWNPQTNDQIEVTNRTLSQLLRYFVISWEEWLQHIEFAYNRAVNTTTSHSSYELMCGFNPLIPPDLLPLPNVNAMLNYDRASKAQFVKDFQAKSCSHIEKKVEQYANKANKEKHKRVHLRNERFPNLRKSKLLPRGDIPSKVIKKINDNAYILDMPQSYEGRTQDSNLKANSFQEKELDESLTSTKEYFPRDKETKDTQTLKGPTTKGRLKRLEEVFQKIGMLRSLEASSLSSSTTLYFQVPTIRVLGNLWLKEILWSHQYHTSDESLHERHQQMVKKRN